MTFVMPEIGDSSHVPPHARRYLRATLAHRWQGVADAQPWQYLAMDYFEFVALSCVRFKKKPIVGRMPLKALEAVSQSGLRIEPEQNL
jgi:hypothetical protein